ncbi:MAG TPA: hypothetical protein VNV86_13125, partial [Candidatus Acidoferrum sp.]|nr:hypothetical protein [Candidatus Acidoferrum sp.]
FIHTSQKLREFDFENLGHRHAAILPKGESWPQESLEYMRQLLGEPDLFGNEPPAGHALP